MANTRTPRASQILTNKAAEAEAAEKAAQQKAQEEARLSNEAKLNAAVADILRPLHEATARVKTLQGEVVKAQGEAATKHEACLYALADFAHDNSIVAEQIRPILDAAMLSLGYSKASLEQPTSNEYKLRTQLARAMLPKISGSIHTVLRPWLAAWDAEAKRKEDEIAAAKEEKRDPVAALLAQPLREKFTSRNNLINQALTLAAGKPAVYSKTGKETTPATASVTFDSIGEFAMPKEGTAPGSVLSWLAANPKVSRGAKTPTAPAAAPAAPAVAADATPRQIAEAEVSDLINRVNAVGSKYPAATALFASILEGLRQCTAARLLPGTPAPSANEPAAPPAAPPAPPASEPVQGASDYDEVAELEREIAMMRRLRALKSGN